ncbi:hypothetical protein ACOMHN_044474 [Nucella lapillus]
MAEQDSLTWQDKVLLFFAVLLFFILILLILLFFCRQRLAKWFPFLVTKIKPDEKTGWHHLDRFGEVKLKWASYNIRELRGESDSVVDGSVQTNISLQVPVFEEKLHGTVTKKSVHMATTDDLPLPELDTPKKKKKKRSSKNRNTADLGDDLDLKDSPGHRSYNEESV